MRRLHRPTERGCGYLDDSNSGHGGSSLIAMAAMAAVVVAEVMVKTRCAAKPIYMRTSVLVNAWLAVLFKGNIPRPKEIVLHFQCQDEVLAFHIRYSIFN